MTRTAKLLSGAAVFVALLAVIPAAQAGTSGRSGFTCVGPLACTVHTDSCEYSNPNSLSVELLCTEGDQSKDAYRAVAYCVPQAGETDVAYGPWVALGWVSAVSCPNGLWDWGGELYRNDAG